MKPQSLKKIAAALKTMLVELGGIGLRDRGLRHRYAEFLVAAALAQRGHTVQVLVERKDNTSADIYLPKARRKRVEVKSCKASEKRGEVDWAYASFRKGNQIRAKKFDYCVFVVFDKSSETVREIFVFTRDELEKVATIRKGLAAHDSNPCLLCCAPTVDAYNANMKLWRIRRLGIESNLRKHPQRYLNAWDKIK
jgi:hypothetical protein